MNQEEKPEAKAKEPPLRYSRPPYTVFLWDGPDPAFTIPGNVLQILARDLAPSGEDVRAMLLKMRNELRWSREAMAALLGVSKDVIRRWETGQRTPSGAARRLIWLFNRLLFHRGKIPTALDLIVWGHGAELAAFSKATDTDWPWAGPL